LTVNEKAIVHAALIIKREECRGIVHSTSNTAKRKEVDDLSCAAQMLSMATHLPTLL